MCLSGLVYWAWVLGCMCCTCLMRGVWCRCYYALPGGCGGDWCGEYRLCQYRGSGDLVIDRVHTWLCWLWLCGAGTWAVCTVKVTVRLAGQTNKMQLIWCLLSNYLSQSNSNLHSAHSMHPSSTQPQPSLPVQNTICGSAHYCSPDDGDNDARNMLRLVW